MLAPRGWNANRMDRRNFFKLVGTASGGAIAGACGDKAEQVIPLLVSDDEIEPGMERWHPSVCGECGAGCGTVARVMSAEREIVIDGERLRQRVAAVKKLEGHRSDPVSGGGLCARGHASLQALYNPDRLHGPLRRVGERGRGEFEPVAWDDALEQAAAAVESALAADPGRIAFLARPRATARSANIARFLEALGAPPARSAGSGDFAAERDAAKRVFGWDGIPVYEIQDATFVLSIGADFLGGWVSPVLYARRYGHMRQGRRELRGRLAHAESRFSLTAWNANRWLPVRPGGELALALGIGRVLLSDKLAPALASAPEEVVAAFESVDPDWAVAVSGIPLGAMRETAEGLSQASAPLVVAGASVVREDSAEAVTVASAINLLLGNVGKPGGVLPPALSGTGLERTRPVCDGWRDRLAAADVVLIDGANPAYNSPGSEAALAAAGTVISFSPFADDTSAYADLILPDHDALERSHAVVPPASPVPAVAATAAFVAPLGDSRSADEVLAALAGAVGRPFELVDPESVLAGLPEQAGPGAERSVPELLREGGWRGERVPGRAASRTRLGEIRAGSPREGLLFQAYDSLQFGGGEGANRPWLQELPDPASSAMWGLPVELDPGTAGSLGVKNGSMVRVASAHGELVAPVYVNPAAIPGVASMGLGQGHPSFGRYASGRGANPMGVVGDLRDRTTGATAYGPVVVTIEKADAEGRLIQFSRQDRDEAPHRV